MDASPLDAVLDRRTRPLALAGAAALAVGVALRARGDPPGAWTLSALGLVATLAGVALLPRGEAGRAWRLGVAGFVLATLAAVAYRRATGFDGPYAALYATDPVGTAVAAVGVVGLVVAVWGLLAVLARGLVDRLGGR